MGNYETETMRMKKNTPEGISRSENNRTIHKSKKDGERKWRATAQNIPKTTDGTDDNVEEADDSTTG